MALSVPVTTLLGEKAFTKYLYEQIVPKSGDKFLSAASMARNSVASMSRNGAMPEGLKNYAEFQKTLLNQGASVIAARPLRMAYSNFLDKKPLDIALRADLTARLLGTGMYGLNVVANGVGLQYEKTKNNLGSLFSTARSASRSVAKSLSDLHKYHPPLHKVEHGGRKRVTRSRRRRRSTRRR